uniref:Uncharacterized protein n=1 Tax=Lepeophtheirus salmonis TaxID=72036 RepID=A0A0K2T5V9_LEPSM
MSQLILLITCHAAH